MLRWIVVGIGDITTKRVIPAIQSEPRSELTCLVTRVPAKATTYGVPAFAALENALRDSNADAVYVASPVFLHAPQTLAALRSGRHVLCEKPMAMNYKEACDMQQAAEDTGHALGIAYYRRTYPKVNRALELITAGAIGRPVLAELNCHSWFHPTDGFREWLIDPARAGGGPLYDIGSHRLDLLNYFFGQPARATGLLSNVVHQTAVEDAATVLVDYQSGVRGIVDVRWHSRLARDDFRIHGTDGMMDLSPLNSGDLKYPGGIESLPPHANLHYPCIENFVSAIESGESPRASGASSLLTDWITGQVVRRSAELRRSQVSCCDPVG
jgi:1,5-anhydro-D-fructose reductase (1,5-anhydro-D-mannitol-forming)